MALLADSHSMPADTDALLRSIRRWLLVVALCLGVGLVALAETGYVTSDYQDGAVFAVTGVVGGVVALAAGVALLGSLAAENDER